MKKFLSLLLAALMLCSCAVAMAEATQNNMTYGVEDTENFAVTDNKTASQSTDMWLQVDATGQIDVEIPLLLVFKTNIDGGDATTGDNYQITNNSSADLVVTDIEVEVEVDEAPYAENENPMELVAYSATGDYADDTYGVQLSVAAQTDSDGETRDPYTVDIKTIEDDADDKITKAAKEGGWFLLADDGEKTSINVAMKTGELSFVTKRMESDDTMMDEDKGVKLLRLTYTVAIDTSDALGVTIEGTGVTGVDHKGTAVDAEYNFDKTYITVPVTP